MQVFVENHNSELTFYFIFSILTLIKRDVGDRLFVSV